MFTVLSAEKAETIRLLQLASRLDSYFPFRVWDVPAMPTKEEITAALAALHGVPV